jgi:hypothetical protein
MKEEGKGGINRGERDEKGKSEVVEAFIVHYSITQVHLWVEMMER